MRTSDHTPTSGWTLPERIKSEYSLIGIIPSALTVSILSSKSLAAAPNDLGASRLDVPWWDTVGCDSHARALG